MGCAGSHGSRVVPISPLMQDQNTQVLQHLGPGRTGGRGIRVVCASQRVQKRKPRCFSTWTVEDERVNKGAVVVIRSTSKDRVWLCLYITRSEPQLT